MSKEFKHQLRAHIFVCTNERPEDSPKGCCKRKGSEEVLSTFKAEVQKRKLQGVRAQKSGCLDRCEEGVTVVVYPQGRWYSKVTSSDVPQILDGLELEGQNL